MPLLAFIALLFSSMLMVPDVHAGQGEDFAHAADHVYAHGADHFDSGEPSSSPHEQDHPSTHHHNCSFNVAFNSVVTQQVFWQSDSLRGPLASSPLVSRESPVLIQPPKA